MKIKELRYGNFRNYGKEGKISFDTEGKLTIIYGTNGDGKTTLHQLFKWILYGEVNFNQTTSSSKLYNLKRGRELAINRYFLVWGQMEFEHNGVNYVARREWGYQKNASGNISRKKDVDRFIVQMELESHDWKELDQPEALIAEAIPNGLSPYFFFDGETMIADLKMRGSESAKSLRTALYSLFDLTVYQKALNDMGYVSEKKHSYSTSTVIGHIYNQKLKLQEHMLEDEAAKKYVREIQILTGRIEKNSAELDSLRNQIDEIGEKVRKISESIGAVQSKRELEEQRANVLDIRGAYEDEIGKIRQEFGSDVANNYSLMLVASAAQKAGERIYLKVQDEEKRIIPGLTKELVKNLINRKTCICGSKLGESELEELRGWLNLFPPASYKSTYDKFMIEVEKKNRTFKEEHLNEYLSRIMQNYTKIKKCNEKIEAIDDAIKDSSDIDTLVNERKQLEAKKRSLEARYSEINAGVVGDKKQKDVREKKLDKYRKSNSEVNAIEEQYTMAINVGRAIREELQYETSEYRKRLEKAIQSLLEEMLTSQRSVVLSDEFELQVKDSFDDESKSEGQFAVVSFAYIGGILKVLQEHERLCGKEYPLVLDGPFSKLDPEQKANVLRTIPQYAPQVIILSKDPLSDVDENAIGKVWTIQSNEEKNDAVISEGYLWDEY